MRQSKRMTVLDDSDALYVFNEQLGGDRKTDYASALVLVDDSFAGHDYEMGEWLPVAQCQQLTARPIKS